MTRPPRRRPAPTSSRARFAVNDRVHVLDEDRGTPVAPGTGDVGLARRHRTDPDRLLQGRSEDRRHVPRPSTGIRYSIPGNYTTVDVDGTIQLLGRGSACINTGGEKVYPEEVNSCSASTPRSPTALVVGVPDERFGEMVVALVVGADGDGSLDEDTLEAWCHGRVSDTSDRAAFCRHHARPLTRRARPTTPVCAHSPPSSSPRLRRACRACPSRSARRRTRRPDPRWPGPRRPRSVRSPRRIGGEDELRCGADRAGWALGRRGRRPEHRWPEGHLRGQGAGRGSRRWHATDHRSARRARDRPRCDGGRGRGRSVVGRLRRRSTGRPGARRVRRRLVRGRVRRGQVHRGRVRRRQVRRRRLRRRRRWRSGRRRRHLGRRRLRRWRWRVGLGWAMAAADASAAAVLPVPVPVPLAARVGRALPRRPGHGGRHLGRSHRGRSRAVVSVRGRDTSAERSERAGGERQGTQPGRRALHTWHGDAPFNELFPSSLVSAARWVDLEPTRENACAAR